MAPCQDQRIRVEECPRSSDWWQRYHNNSVPCLFTYTGLFAPGNISCVDARIQRKYFI